ncbi:MAG: LysM peptidoglycan-binding domain-containing protein, partial [Flavobacteriales bacterium]|nr:LysM peptidoglycan-binding domain-containing protein [Flavobacteriales bacterium]
MRKFLCSLSCPGLLLVTLSVLLSSCKSGAQVQAPVEKIDGTEYYMHLVKKGETAYGISKTYQCDINDILSSNPGSDQGLTEGSSI